MRLVLDTNVVISGFLWDGPPRRLISYGRKPGVTLFTSASLLAELIDTLSRPKFEKKIAALLFSPDQLVDLYSELAVVVRPNHVPRLAPDPDDDVVIGTALAARAEFIVTGDRTLLAVMHYQDIRIVSVTEALELLTSQ